MWGEERIEGAVYTVYLKKVRYHSPSKSITNVSQTFLICLQSMAGLKYFNVLVGPKHLLTFGKQAQTFTASTERYFRPK